MDLSQMQQPQVDLSKATDLECEECKHKLFKQSYMVKKLSAFVSPTGEEVVIPIQVFSCESCGHINKIFKDSVKEL